MFKRLHKALLTTTALVPLGIVVAIANPQGPQVVGGSASVQGQGTPTVTVTQTTYSAIVNWNTFNIGAGEKTNIVMPNAGSVQLDRVTGGLGPSQILGSLWSNGRVFLVNPDGILFGSGAKVDTAGFLATTHDIANSDFMAGKYNFSISGRPDASIVNQGSITAQTGGFAALVAPGVRNSGTITATLGTVALASGNGFSLDFYGDKLITLSINNSIATTVKDVATGQPLSALVSNDSKLSANGGRVELTAAAARIVVNSVINTSGIIEANTIGNKNGMIVLGAATTASKPAGAPTQTVKASGKLSAAGKNAVENGGKVQITGEAIEVIGAKIDASGPAGGGKVFIGGSNPSSALASIDLARLESFAAPTASTVSIDAATSIDVSATVQGNGGKAIVWSDQQTSFAGSILARGGPNGGNGGFVETSGHTLDFTGARVDTSAPKGWSGSWLLDPYDLTINSGAASTISTSLATTNVTVQTGASGSSGPGNPNPSGNGDIFVASNILWNSSNKLTLSAYRNVVINNGVTITNTSPGVAILYLGADNSGTGTGTVNFIGTGKVDFSNSGGVVKIYYNPVGGYANPTNFSSSVLTNPSQPFLRQLLSSMLVNNVVDLQNIILNLAGSYALNKNIDATATAAWNGGAGFLPLGNIASPFTGVLDGQGYAIDKLSINSSAPNVGLFGVTQGSIDRLGLTNVSTHGNFATGIGAVAGRNDGDIFGVYATGAVNGTANVIGGLIGQNNGALFQSYSTAAVSGSGQTGGLVGTAGLGSFGSANYWDIQTSGQTISASGIGLATAQLKSGLPSGFASSVWAINPSINNGYPYLISQAPAPLQNGGGATSPSLPPGFVDVFGNGQTNFFSNPINIQIARSTPPVITNLNTTTSTPATGQPTTPVSTNANTTTTSQLVWNAVQSIYEPTINKKTIAVPPQQESLSLLDCLATVFAMIGDLSAAIAGTQPATPYTHSAYENTNGFATFVSSVGAPPIQLIGGESELDGTCTKRCWLGTKYGALCQKSLVQFDFLSRNNWRYDYRRDYKTDATSFYVSDRF